LSAALKILCLFGRHAYGEPSRGEGYEHANFLPALAALGHEVALFDSFDRQGYRDFADLNLQLIEKIQTFRPDIVFSVLMHYEVWFETLDLIRSRSPAAVVNWGTDDSWKFRQFSRFLCGHVDLHVTTDAGALAAAAKLGITNIIGSQWAASSARLAEPRSSSACSYDVSFVGMAYGNRRAHVDALARRGIEVACFGHGWPRGAVDRQQVLEVYRASRITLNFADSGLQMSGGLLRHSRQIKARTFEVPGAGGFLLTEQNPDLGTYFRLGDELIPYGSDDDLVAKIQFYLRHPEDRDRIARAAHDRVRREHLYEKRFVPIIDRAISLVGERRNRPWELHADLLLGAVAKYRRGAGLRRMLDGLKDVSGNPARRFRRGLRRLTYELSWRLCGARTFRAAGLPGRFFYRES
jgi:spore maturation protein CgeB